MQIKIFTDGGGYQQKDGTYNSASAVRLFINDVLVNSYSAVHINKTSNYSEIFAIAKGLELAKTHIDKIVDEDIEYEVTVFTDSELYVKSLNTWIYNWMKKAKDGVLYKSNNEKVINQELILAAYKVMKKIDNVDIYHINSHQTQKDIAKGFERFKTTNKVNISFIDYLFAVVQNHKCDEMVGLAYDKYLMKGGQSEDE